MNTRFTSGRISARADDRGVDLLLHHEQPEALSFARPHLRLLAFGSARRGRISIPTPLGGGGAKRNADGFRTPPLEKPPIRTKSAGEIRLCQEAKDVAGMDGAHASRSPRETSSGRARRSAPR